MTQVDLNSCIALPALCAPGATWAEPAKVCGGHVPRVDTGVQSFPITSIPLPFHKGMAQFSSLLSALQTWGLSGAEILCTFASTELTRLLPSLSELRQTLTRCDSYNWSRLSSYSTNLKEVDCVAGVLLHLFFTKPHLHKAALTH